VRRKVLTIGATCPQNAVVDVEEPEDRNLEDTGREQIFGDHGKFVEDEVGDQDELPADIPVFQSVLR
jgi:hypothetical protein